MLDPKGALQLQLLGSCEINSGEGELRFESKKARALLIYLVMNPGSHQRDKLMDLFWGDFPEPNARRNLRHALWNLRQKLNSLDSLPVLVSDTQIVTINLEADIWLDINVFQDVLDQHSGGSWESRLPALSDAMELYRGDFLDGFHVRNASAFEEWALIERERLRTLAMGALQQLLEGYAQQGEYAVALDFARHLLIYTPWREQTHRQVMRLLEANDQPETAMVQYESCRRVLAEELGVEPATETIILFEKIKIIFRFMSGRKCST